MELILILIFAVLIIYYIVKQIREPGYAIFPLNRIREYGQGTAYAVQEKSCVADEQQQH
ncbi:hypothetical protein [Zhaonella formicivorans]|uniref:hypothetical protein n=1 Tax=Zhaonella formicivorans TaxID=2528593 RepID=UPI001D112BCD|nr:hypothetical protein [Zhaonella formicivorans]